MASPSMTFNTAANVLSSASLAASGTVTANLDFSAKFEGQVQVWNTPGGTVAATSGMQVDVFEAVDSTPNYDTVACYSMVIPSVASTAARATIKLSTGKYQIKLTNLDATNAVTREVSSATVDSIA